jgi:hypothetical protein
MKASNDAFGPADLRLLDALRAHDRGLRALLCTIARHGAAMQQRSPQRAQRWLDELASHPLFKGGQFLFDLLEWEDFMLDGEPPPVVDQAAVRLALDRLAAGLRAAGAAIDPGGVADVAIDLGARGDADALPAPESGFYLFPCVVLGAISLLGASVSS